MSKRFISMLLVVAIVCTLLPVYFTTASAATQLSATPYPLVEYGYTTETPAGIIRYIAQNSSSAYFSWNYWPASSFGSYANPETECGTACISMALSYVGVNRTPKVLLEATNGVTANMWGKQGDASSKAISHTTSAISSAMNDYINGSGKYSPLCIYIVPFSATSSMHWVLLVGKLGENKYLALNPWHTAGTNATFTIQINGTTATYNGTTNPIQSVNQWYNPNASTEIAITFNANDGSCGTSQKTITPGSAIGTLPTPTRSGYDFAGWYYDKAASYDDPVSSSTTFSSATTLYAHWASQLYKGNKITFNAQGGQLPGAFASRTIDGYNIGRGGNELIVYNCAGNTVNTNSYGVEVAVNSEGKVTSKRAYGSTSTLTVPSGGFVLSGHLDASSSGGNFVAAIEVGNYVAYNKSANKAYVYTSKNAYLANQKYVSSGSTYGELPTPTNGSKAFQGWYTAASGGTKITSSSTYSALTLYARWDCDHSYNAEYIPGNCVQYASVKYTCTKCGHSYTEHSTGEYSEWSTTYPTGIDASLVQSKNQYRYSDYETKTSYEASLSGWTHLHSEWIKSGSGNIKYVSSWPSGFSTSHSLYSTYNNSPKSNSETSTTKTTVSSSSTCGYIYYHWCRGTYTGGPINRKTSTSYTSEFNTFHAFYSTTAPSSLGSPASDGSYIYSNGSCCKDSYWYYPITVYSQDYTTYNKLFTYYRWTSWSDWSDSAYYTSDTRKVETRTLYRYATSPLGEHSWDNGTVTKQPTCSAEGVRTYTCSVCGEIKTEAIAKTEHQYNAGTVTKEPTCTEDGVKTFTCTSCGTTKTENVSKLGHNYVSGYCTRCGATDPSYTFVTASVKVGSVTANGGETATIPVYLSNNTGIAGFTFTVKHQDGIKLTEIKAGDLLSSGIFESNVETGKVTWFDSKNINDDGILLYLTFEIGSTSGSFAITVELANGASSNFVDENYSVKPVQFEGGTIVVDAHTHSYEAAKVSPTCTEQGYTTYTCSCGDSYKGDYTEALGHEWTAWETVVEATLTQEGSEERTCTRCDEVESRTTPKAQNPFVDVKESDYFYTPVLWAVQQGVTNGTTATTFSPDDPCTRGQVVTFLWRACGSPEPKLTVNPFKDISSSAYYYKAVMWAIEKGITAGTSANTFSPDDACTRAQVATFLWRAQGKPVPTASDNPFNDVNSNAYYYSAVLWAVENEITNGTGIGKFSPDDSCTRGQIVTFLYRALN